MDTEVKENSVSEYRSIKDLVIETCISEGAFPSYEKLTSLVLKHFPTSRWQKTHYAWYKSKIKRGEIAVPGSSISKTKGKKVRTDGQLSGMAGEFLVAGKLFKRGMQVSVTLGNAKSIDLLVYNPKVEKTYTVQVKTVRCKNCFPMKRENIRVEDIYVFVVLNKADDNEEFFIVRGKTILEDLNKFFGTCYTRTPISTFPGINYGPLKEYRDNWEIFQEG